MNAPLPGEPAPLWVTLTFLATLGSGVLLLVGEVVDKRIISAVGLAALIAGIIAMSVSVVLASRKAGITRWSAMWRGVKAAGALFRDLAP